MIYKSSDILIRKIKEFEGCRLNAYKPVSTEKYYTIGYGHYGPDVKPNTSISEKEAEDFLRSDIKKFENYVNKLNVCKTQGQFDALVDFAYNCGTGNLHKSTLLVYIRQGKPDIYIQGQFRLWNKAGGKVQPGLTKRREWEAERYAQE